MAGLRFNEQALMQRLIAPFRKITALMLRKKKSAFVRHAAQKDAQQFAALHAEGDFSQSWSQDDFEVFLTDRSRPERLYGFVLSRRAGDEAEILTIALARAVRGRGWSRVLLSHHLSHLTNLGTATLFLEVEDGNRPAMALYQSQGFTVIGKRPAYYHRRDGSQALALVMRLSLGGF
jgi:ribosomal-protein-alanine N-acetyltransferase